MNKTESLLCVGLDVDSSRIPSFLFDTESDPLHIFLQKIIDATKNNVCAYKLNLAFYEALGVSGFDLLQKTISSIPSDIVVILDGKRNDIGNTAQKYAQALYETFHADAVTINPYLGSDSVHPFLTYEDKYSFILCRTSNPSAADFQDLISDTTPLYQHVATKIKEWNATGNCGAVVGATYPKELKTIRSIVGDDCVLLIPGVGAQGGSVEKAVVYGTNRNGEHAIITSSRGIIYASSDETFAQKAQHNAHQLQKQINSFRTTA